MLFIEIFIVASVGINRSVQMRATPWKRSTMVDVVVAIVLRLGVKKQKRFQLSSARTTLSSRPPPLFRAGVLSRWLFPALMERLFSAHKMKWISAPEPEIGRRRQFCHPPSPSFFASFFIVVSFPRFSSCTDRCGRVLPVSLEGASLFGLTLHSLEQIFSDSPYRDNLSESLNRDSCNRGLLLGVRNRFC